MTDAGWGSHRSSLLGTGVGLARLLGTPVANSVHSQGGGGHRLSGRAAIPVTSGFNPWDCGRHATHRGTGGGRPAPPHNAPCWWAVAPIYATIKRSLLAEGVAGRGGRDLDAPARTLRGPGAHGDDAHWPERPPGTRAGGGDAVITGRLQDTMIGISCPRTGDPHSGAEIVGLERGPVPLPEGRVPTQPMHACAHTTHVRGCPPARAAAQVPFRVGAAGVWPEGGVVSLTQPPSQLVGPP